MTGIKLSDRFTGSLPLEVCEHMRVDEEYSSKTVKELLKMLDTVYTPHPEENLDHDKWTGITAVLATRFNLLRVRDADKVIREILNEMIDKQNELIKAFLSHRHNKDENYSGKPVW